ncbi:MAG: efflux RND transporter periplasmic adaptor subunit [Firmicutes bacterium]|nr:efflux RND transporter periplasmic adaptor subunit [Bacillota bacterium]
MNVSIQNKEKDKKKVIREISIIFFLVIVLLTFFSNTINNFSLPGVSVEEPQEAPLLKQIINKGLIESKEIVDVYFEGDISTKIEEVNIEVGDKVKKGDILIIAEKEDVDEQIEQELVLLGKLKFVYQESLKAKESQANLVKLIRAIETAKDNIDDTEERYEKVKRLYDSGAESLMNLREAEKNFKKMQRYYHQCVQDYNIAKENEIKNIKMLEYDIKLQQLKIKKMRETLDYDSEITASFDGIVKGIYISKGSRVSNSTKMYSITNLEKGFEFRTDIDTDSVDFLKIGDKAEVRIKSWDDNAIGGKVGEIKESESFKGEKKEILIDISDERITGGEQGEVYIEKRTENFSLVLPNAALVPGLFDEQKYVWILKEKKGFLGNEYNVELCEVKVLDSDNFYTAVSGNITSDDRIVIKNDKHLHDGGRVIIEKDTSME